MLKPALRVTHYAANTVYLPAIHKHGMNYVLYFFLCSFCIWNHEFWLPVCFRYSNYHLLTLLAPISCSETSSKYHNIKYVYLNIEPCRNQRQLCILGHTCQIYSLHACLRREGFFSLHLPTVFCLSLTSNLHGPLSIFLFYYWFVCFLEHVVNSNYCCVFCLLWYYLYFVIMVCSVPFCPCLSVS